jgi:hypothetical protein
LLLQLQQRLLVPQPDLLLEFLHYLGLFCHAQLLLLLLLLCLRA